VCLCVCGREREREKVKMKVVYFDVMVLPVRHSGENSVVLLEVSVCKDNLSSRRHDTRQNDTQHKGT
jgi:hypothetical protein